MPDAAAALAPPASPASQALTTDPYVAAVAKYGRAQKQAATADSDIDKAHLTELHRLDDREDALKMPEMQQVPPPQQKETDPQKVWGSMAMMMAVFGSLMTRTPLTTAMNSAAAAIKAFHQGDQEAFQTAFDSWKVANENATKLWEFQQKTYEQILGKLDRERSLSDQEANAQRREVAGQLTAAAAAFRDDVMATHAANMDMEGAERTHIMRDSLGVRAQEAQSKIDAQKAQHEALQQLQQTDEWKNASPMDRLKLMRKNGLVDEKNDPFANPQKVQAMIGKFTGSVEGKANSAAQDGNNTIQDLVSNPATHIATNPDAQITLVDKFIYMSTGSVRPGLAQYQKVLGAQTGQDFFDIVTGKVAHHPVLGRDQINNIAKSAKVIAQAADRSYKAMLNRPENKQLATELGILPEDHGTGYPTPDADTEQRDKGILQEKVQSDPANRATYISHFDAHYGKGAAEQILGGP